MMRTNNFLRITKKALHKTGLQCLLFLALLATEGINAYGQLGPINASFLDLVITGSMGGTSAPSMTLNSASIDYYPFYNSNNLGPSWQLTAVVSDYHTAAPPTLFVTNNFYTGGWVNMPLPYAGPIAVYPDVAIGNDPAGGISGAYYIGVVVNYANVIYLLRYHLTGQGSSGPLTITGPTVYNLSASFTAVGAPHIDIVARYNTLFPPVTGKPYCDYFIATWQDAASGIMAYYGQLSAMPAVPVPTVIDNSLTAYAPDVAAVQRASCGFWNDWGMFTYLDTASGSAAVMETDWSAGSLTSLKTVYDQGTFANGPRIDAIDDYNYNAPGPLVTPCAAAPTNAYFTIVASGIPNGKSVPTNGSYYIMQYNNWQGPYAGQDITWGSFTSSLSMPASNPVVACGPNNHYTIEYGFDNSGFFSSSLNGQFVAQTTDWNPGLTSPPTAPPYLTADCYQIPQVCGGILIFPLFPCSISSTCNTDVAPPSVNAQELFTCWEAPDPSFGSPNFIAYKYPKIGLGNPYLTFRQANTGTNNIKAGTKWELSPNPASEYVKLAGPENHSYGGEDNYSITDIAGRQLQQAAISKQNESIGVQKLAPGTYMMHVYEAGKETSTMQFVKE